MTEHCMCGALDCRWCRGSGAESCDRCLYDADECSCYCDHGDYKDECARCMCQEEE